MDSASPFAGILVGQPQLRRRLRLGSFAALDQRIALRYELEGMDARESNEYIAHHLKLAGREDQLLSDDAVALLHERARGIPRASTTSRPKRSSPPSRRQVARRRIRRTSRRHRSARRIGQRTPRQRRPGRSAGSSLRRYVLKLDGADILTRRGALHGGS